MLWLPCLLGMLAGTGELSARPPQDVRPAAASSSVAASSSRGVRNVTDVNANSGVVRLRLGTRSVLLMGHAEQGGRQDPTMTPDPDSIEGRLLACRADLRADGMVVGHHGSRTSSRSSFVDAVGAKDFVISAGPTRYATMTLPDADVAAELQARGNIWRAYLDEAACEQAKRKVGRDADGQPGGCDNVRPTMTDGAVKCEYIDVLPAW